MIFRRSIFRDSNMWLIVFGCLFDVLFMLCEPQMGAWGLLVFALPLMMFIIFSLYFWRYVEITDKELIVRWACYPTIVRRFAFDDIVKAEIYYTWRMKFGAYLRVTTSAKRPYNKPVECVHWRDYQRIVDCLRSHGVTVETSGLEIFEK